MKTLGIDTQFKQPPTRDYPTGDTTPQSLPPVKSSHSHPTKSSANSNARLFFVGTATTILEWEGIRLMTDPNFLHAGDHVHLGPGVTATRLTNPAVDLHQLPHIDLVLLSHYHADHFDQLVEDSLRRDLPIVTTPHAKKHLANKNPSDESFTQVHDLDFWESLQINISGDNRAMSTEAGSKAPQIKVTGMPGKHIPDIPVISTLNDLLGAVPPTNGWMLELGYNSSGKNRETDSFSCGYRIYISGDTLMINDLKKIPEMYTHAGKPIDLMLIHLGGTTIPSPQVPLLMVTMDAKQGIELLKLVQPDLTIPIHYDDYDVFLSPLSDFKKEIDVAGLQSKVVYLDRGDDYSFEVRES